MVSVLICFIASLTFVFFESVLDANVGRLIVGIFKDKMILVSLWRFEILFVSLAPVSHCRWRSDRAIKPADAVEVHPRTIIKRSVGRSKLRSILEVSALLQPQPQAQNLGADILERARWHAYVPT